METKYLIPIPKIDEGNKFIIIQPHPDDADIYVGGFAISMLEKGKEVIYLTVSEGALGTTKSHLKPQNLIKIRQKESEKSAKVIGITKNIKFGYPSTDYLTHKKLRTEFIGVFREEKPDGIFLPDPWLPYEAHQGHIIVGLAGAEAALFSPLPNYEPKGIGHDLKFIAFYASHKPNTFFEITEYWERKLIAINKHKSQFSPEIFKLLTQYLEVKSEEWGRLGGYKKAEAFKVLSPYHLHGNVDSWNI